LSSFSIFFSINISFSGIDIPLRISIKSDFICPIISLIIWSLIEVIKDISSSDLIVNFIAGAVTVLIVYSNKIGLLDIYKLNGVLTSNLI